MMAYVCPYEPSWSRAVYHLYVIRTDDRDGMMQHLKEAGIGTGIHYPIPLHLQKAYASLNYSSGDFPVADELRPKSSPCRCSRISPQTSKPG